MSLDKELLDESLDDLQDINTLLYYWIEYEDNHYLRNVKEIDINDIFDPENYDWIVRIRHKGNSENWSSSNIIADLNIGYTVQELFPINVLCSESVVHSLFIPNLASIKEAKKIIQDQVKYSFTGLIKKVNYKRTRKTKIYDYLN